MGNVIDNGSGIQSKSHMVTITDILPDDISMLILEYTVDSTQIAFTLSLTSRRWYTLLMQGTAKPHRTDINQETNDHHVRTNTIWKMLSLRQWDLQHDINVKNWVRLYSRRQKLILSKHYIQNLHFIENCDDIKLNCPLEYENLLFFFEDVNKDRESVHCYKCSKSVYICKTKEEVVQHKQQGHCVAFMKKESVAEKIKHLAEEMKALLEINVG